MKSLFLLLLVLRCGQTTKTTSPWAVSKPPIETPAPKSPPDDDHPPEPSESPEETEELELIPISTYEISSYLSLSNPYYKEYEKFFDDQLQTYGRDDNESLIVSRRDLLNLGYRYNVYLCGSSSKILLVISNDLSNQYPLP